MSCGARKVVVPVHGNKNLAIRLQTRLIKDADPKEVADYEHNTRQD